MTRSRRALTAALTCVLVGAGLLAVTTPSAQAARPKVTLKPVGSRFVGAAIPVVGSVSGTSARHDKTVVLQHKAGGVWHGVARLRHRSNGRFTFPARHVATPQTARWRAMVKSHGKVLDVSNVLAVKVIAHTPPPPDDLLPDLVVRNITLCSDAEQAEAQLGCFRVEPFTEPNGTTVRLLKFPGSTFNIGKGPMEVRSHRDNADVGILSWHDTLTVQRVYNAGGGFRDINITPKIDFYWEDEPNGAVDSHGHHHWHILDFDSYTDNGAAAAQEKHGFCISSSGTTGPSLPGAGVLDPAYDDISACGFGQTNVADIVHGLSPLYGDTYPSSLDDQGIDITRNVNGVHHIQVCADQANVLLESDETNNCASADVTVAGGVVTAVANGTGFPH